MWSRDIKKKLNMILKKSLISTFGITMATNFSKVWLSWVELRSWVDHNHWITWLIYHVITLYSQKGVSPVLQRQWPSNLVVFWIKMKGPHLLFQVTGQSSDHMFCEKRLVSTNAGPQNSAGDINHRKTHKSKAFFVVQKILTFDSHPYTPL